MNKSSDENEINSYAASSLSQPVLVPLTNGNFWMNNNNLLQNNSVIAMSEAQPITGKAFLPNNNINLNYLQQQPFNSVTSAFSNPKTELEMNYSQALNVINNLTSLNILPQNMSSDNIWVNRNIDQFILNNPANFDIEQQVRNILMLFQKQKQFMNVQQKVEFPLHHLSQFNQIKQQMSNEEIKQFSKNYALPNSSVDALKIKAAAVTAANAFGLYEKELDSGNETQCSTSPAGQTSLSSSPASSSRFFL